MNSSLRFLSALVGGLVLHPLMVSAQVAPSESAGLIGKRYAGADFNYDHFSGSSIDRAMTGTAMLNLPLTPILDATVAYGYTDTSGPNFDAIDKVVSASLLTHRLTEYGTGYFAATLGHLWNRVTAPGTLPPANGAYWGVRAGYEVPVAPRTAVNAGVAYADAFESANTRAQVWRFYVEANHWFSRDVAGVLGISYRQLKESPDAISYTGGLRWAF